MKMRYIFNRIILMIIVASLFIPTVVIAEANLDYASEEVVASPVDSTFVDQGGTFIAEGTEDGYVPLEQEESLTTDDEVDTDPVDRGMPMEEPGEELGNDLSQEDESTEIESSDEAQSDYGIFVIEDGVLHAYNGSDVIVFVPDGVRVIGESAFALNTAIVTVVLPDSVEEIATAAFDGCEELETIQISEDSKLAIIGDFAFRNDSRLDTSFIEHVDVISESAFFGVAPDSFEGTEEVTDEGSEATEEVADEAGESTEEVTDEAGEVTEEVADEVSEVTEEVADEVSEVTEEVANEAGESLEEVAGEADENLEEVADEAGEGAEEVANEAGEGLEGVADEADENLEEVADEVGEGTEEVLGEAYEGVEEVAGEAGGEVTEEIAGEAYEGIEEVLGEAYEGVEEVAGEAGGEVTEEIAGEAYEGIEEVAGETGGEGTEEVADEVGEGTEEAVDEAYEGVEEVIGEADEGVEEVTDVDIKDEGDKETQVTSDVETAADNVNTIENVEGKDADTEKNKKAETKKAEEKTEVEDASPSMMTSEEKAKEIVDDDKNAIQPDEEEIAFEEVDILSIMAEEETVSEEAAMAQAGWSKENGKWYYYDTNGTKHTGWLNLGGRWFYFNSDGVMVTGFRKIGGRYFYFEADPKKDEGLMVTGWYDLSSTRRFYFEADPSKDLGKMYTGFNKIGGKWYFFENDPSKDEGCMTTGWRNVSGTRWFYFDATTGSNRGVMATGFRKIGGRYFYFEADPKKDEGLMVTGWYDLSSTRRFYFEADPSKDIGKMYTGFNKIGGKWYFFENDPSKDEGVMIKGWKKLANNGETNWHYFNNDTDAYMLTSTTKSISNESCTFDANGRLTNVDTGTFIYAIKNNLAGATLTSYLANANTVVVPDTYREIPITEIGDDAFNGKSLSTVTLPSTVEVIGARAFKDCANLKSMN